MSIQKGMSVVEAIILEKKEKSKKKKHSLVAAGIGGAALGAGTGGVGSVGKSAADALKIGQAQIRRHKVPDNMTNPSDAWAHKVDKLGEKGLEKLNSRYTKKFKKAAGVGAAVGLGLGVANALRKRRKEKQGK